MIQSAAFLPTVCSLNLAAGGGAGEAFFKLRRGHDLLLGI
jgi:hypothetical protein